MEMKEYPYDLREKVRFEFVSELGKTVNKIKKIADEMENPSFEQANEWLKRRIENERENER